MIFKSLSFWSLVAGLLAFVAKFFYPTFPFDAVAILAGVLFLLGLFGVVPSIRARGVLGADLLKSLAFWQMVVGLVAFCIHFFIPDFPFGETELLAGVLFILGLFSINPELRARRLK